MAPCHPIVRHLRVAPGICEAKGLEGFIRQNERHPSSIEALNVAYRLNSVFPLAKVNFTSGQKEATFLVPVIHDQEPDEGCETFMLAVADVVGRNVSAVVEAGIHGIGSKAVVAIEEEDFTSAVLETVLHEETEVGGGRLSPAFAKVRREAKRTYRATLLPIRNTTWCLHRPFTLVARMIEHSSSPLLLFRSLRHFIFALAPPRVLSLFACKPRARESDGYDVAIARLRFGPTKPPIKARTRGASLEGFFSKSWAGSSSRHFLTMPCWF